MNKQHFTLAAVQVLFAVQGVAQQPAMVNVIVNAPDNGPITIARMEGLANAAAEKLTQLVQTNIEVAGTVIVNLMYLGEMTMEEFLGQPVAQDVTDITGQVN